MQQRISRFFFIFQGMQIHMKSDRGEIEVFLCPEEEAPLTAEISDSDSEVTASPLKIKKETEDAIEDLISLGPGSSTVMPPSGPTWEAPSRTGGPDEDQSIRNVLIWESEDLGPIGNRFQQQTVDQDNHHGKTFHFYFSKTQSTKFKKIPITDSSRRYCCSVM